MILVLLGLVLALAACSDRTTTPGSDGGGPDASHVDASSVDSFATDLVQPDTALPDMAQPDLAPPDGPAQDKDPCGPGTTLCGGLCVNTLIDGKNCGG